MKHGPILDKNTLSNSSVLMISLRYMGFEQRTCVHQHNPVATAESSPLKNNGKQLKDRCNQFNLFITTRSHDYSLPGMLLLTTLTIADNQADFPYPPLLWRFPSTPDVTCQVR